MADINIVLHQPRIPQNTGNIARTCAATSASLHLIHPLGFQITNSKLKRAGLDYWHLLSVYEYKDLDDFFDKNKGNCYFFTTKTTKNYTDVNYLPPSYLLFGREDQGLPEELLYDNKDSCVNIPMREDARSLNLSNAAAVATYEVIRQWGGTIK